MDDRHDLPESGAEGEEPPVFGPPHPGRARIAGVEAGVAAGLTPSTAGERGRRDSADRERRIDDGSVEREPETTSVPLPAWTDPPTREVPRVLRDLSDDSSPALPGPVWREEETDWDSDSLAFAEFISQGSSVAEHGAARGDEEDGFDDASLRAPRRDASPRRAASARPSPQSAASEASGSEAAASAAGSSAAGAAGAGSSAAGASAAGSSAAGAAGATPSGSAGPEGGDPRPGSPARDASDQATPDHIASERAEPPLRTSGTAKHRRSGVVWAGRRQASPTERPEGEDAAGSGADEGPPTSVIGSGPGSRPGQATAPGPRIASFPTGSVPPGLSPGASHAEDEDEDESTQLLERTSSMEVPSRSARRGPRARLLFAGRGRPKTFETAGAAAPASSTLSQPFDGEDEPAQTTGQSGRRNPVVATLTGLVIGGVALLCFLVGPPAVLALACAAFVLAMAECYQGFRKAHYHPAVALGLVATPAAAVAGYLKGTQAVLLTIAAFVFVAFCWYLAGITKQRRVPNLAVTVLGWLWIGGLGSFAGLLVSPSAFGHRHGLAYLLGALEAVVAYDVGGYLFGSLLGEHKLAPTISPNKTWEGLLGGSLCALVVAIAITRLMAPWTLGRAIALGVMVAIVAPLGDLAESMIKRELGLKDMGTLLPAHGGLLDRIDAILFVIPATYYLVLAFHG